MLENLGELLPSRLRREIETDPAAEHGRRRATCKEFTSNDPTFREPAAESPIAMSHRMKAGFANPAKSGR
jgi:hypothetical protein